MLVCLGCITTALTSPLTTRFICPITNLKSFPTCLIGFSNLTWQYHSRFLLKVKSYPDNLGGCNIWNILSSCKIPRRKRESDLRVNSPWRIIPRSHCGTAQRRYCCDHYRAWTPETMPLTLGSETLPGQAKTPLEVSEGAWPHQHSDFGFWISSLQKCERINLCSFKSSSLQH